MVWWCNGLSKRPVPGRPTIVMIVGQGPIALAVDAGGGCLDFTLLLSFLTSCGWSGGAMVLGKLPVPGRPGKFTQHLRTTRPPPPDTD